MLLARESVFRSSYFSEFFLFMILFLMIILFCSFGSVDLFSFYLFFEGRLVPTLFLILGWGYQPERLQAGIYLILYTLFASLPLLVGVIGVYNSSGLLCFFFLSDPCLSRVFFYFCMVFAFLVRIPLFLVHLWLPRAHVEAPISGSMILAGVLLKLGGYGLIRVMVFLVNFSFNLNFFWISISLLGGFLVRLVCLRQTDLKSLVAYSSVAHIGIVVCGIMTVNYWGFCGSYVLMIAHGLCSSGLFCLVNIVYERTGSRSLLVNRGLMCLIPRMSIWWFLLRSCNIAAPPSLNLLGEVVLFRSLVSWSWLTILMLGGLSFFGAAYTLYIYSYSQHGSFYSGIYSCSIFYVREFLLVFLHWFPLNLLILFRDVVSFWL
jgi:NADH-ubiquinone oxidoreductase chain 4